MVLKNILCWCIQGQVGCSDIFNSRTHLRAECLVLDCSFSSISGVALIQARPHTVQADCKSLLLQPVLTLDITQQPLVVVVIITATKEEVG